MTVKINPTPEKTVQNNWVFTKLKRHQVERYLTW